MRIDRERMEQIHDPSKSMVHSDGVYFYNSIILAHFYKYSGEQSYGLGYTIKF
jgi:hypothetical protein